MKNNYLRLVMMLLLAVVTGIVSAVETYDYEALFDFYNVNEDGDTIWYNITSDSTCEVTFRYGIRYEDEDGAFVDIDDDDTLRYVGTINIPSTATNSDNGVTYTVAGIGKYAFILCTQLEKVSLPSTLIYIGDRAFMHCTGLTEIDLPEGLKWLETRAFYDTGISSVTLPSSLDSIEGGIFEECYKFTTIEVNEGNNYFSAKDNVLFDKEMTTLLQYPAGLTDDTYPVPASVKIISDFSFSYNSHLKAVTMTSVESIGANAFYQCFALESVKLSPSLKFIGDFAFEEDSLLTSIVIPASVEDIEDGVFSGCLNLSTIDVEEGNKYYTSTDGVLYTIDKKYLLCYPAGKKDSEYTVLPECKVICWEAFEGNRYLANVDLPENLDTIETAAFSFCTSLEKIDIPASVRFIDNAVVQGCSSLSSITVDSKNQYYMAMDSVLFNKDTTTLLAFAANKAVTTYEIPSSVDTIYLYAFNRVQNLKKVVIPTSVKCIALHAFRCELDHLIDTVVCKNTVPPYDVYFSTFADVVTENGMALYEHALLVVPDGCKALYENAYPWSLFRNIVEESKVTGINEINADNTPASVIRVH